MKRIHTSFVLTCLTSAILWSPPAMAITIPTVPVGNPGNANDPLSGNLYGGVSYDYRIGTTEVTNKQYAEFLNAKASSNSLELYNQFMGTDASGGITQSGISGSFTYATRTNMADKPVNFVSWYDSIRFANWVNNGQGTGDTETGAYTLLGGTPTPSNGNSVTRNPGATWFLSSENEWCKSAYYQSAGQGGDSDGYWLYPTASNVVPAVATANSVGDISNPGANVANYGSAIDWNGFVTTVGSAGSLSDSFYGTADQGGNVWEWNEALITGSRRGLRGGSFFHSADSLQSSNRGFNLPSSESFAFGFRVATVPEPSTLVLAALGFCAVSLIWKRRARRCPTATIVLFALLIALAADAQAITIPTVPVGDAGNGNDPLTGNLYGGVGYVYRIGTTEVTNAQYAEFLNAKAKSDPLGLYNSDMGMDFTRGGITRTGASGSYTYSLKPNMANKPVNHVSWYDSIRFANWLNNGQGTGDTETGAYTLLGGTAAPSNGPSITRNPGATWFLPSDNEWYKAAYYQPAVQGGDVDNYWLYATGSNSAPTLATAIDLAGPTRGDIANPGLNVANLSGANWDGVDDGNVTTVGSAGPLSQSFYGTSDQVGNVWEWNEQLVFGMQRRLRGGSWFTDTADLLSSSSSFSLNTPMSQEISGFGFRVATVPEPSTLVLTVLVALGLLITTRRKR